ncbi:MAG: glutamine synthetase III, partial [Bacteroidales bacterium]|nr:glutamine synthetase III [Bacteroidales bacterium]
MSSDRFDLVKESFEKKAVPAEVPEGKPSDYFGELVFDRKKMAHYLDPKTFAALQDCIDKERPLDPTTADKVAEGMKVWALEHHVTHVTHWFQPLTEGTAEKHDSLIEYDGKGGVIEKFDGRSLAQQEPDASSFPNGGIRATFEARGYTAWDPTSPVFIMEDTLCIPTVFVAYTGEALDYKTPLKKALKAVSDAAVPICRLFDPSVRKVYSYLGWEQEYFLVDESLYAARPDLMITGRTLMGHASSKNQQLDDHYFAAIPSRVAEFMRDLEITGHRLGIPIKTRHNEVAPNQFELAPIFGETNLSNDQNQLLMNLMNKIGRKHGFVVLLHEKPFEGVNGSGKHNNWSLGTDTGTLLLAPGKDAMGNLQFVTFFVNVLAAVQKHNALMKASIASATNAHRLGGNEAPPAIVSAFLGRTMTDVLRKLLVVPSDTPIEIAGKKGKSLGLEIPEIFVDNTDRNRTSPFAFTGNRFEFRAVGSSSNCAGAMTTLNAAVAEQLMAFKEDLDRELASGKPLNVATLDTLKPIIASIIDVVCFDGNGYAPEWAEEARLRGLDTETSVPEMIKVFTKPESVEMFRKTGVYTEKELEARNEVKWEMYIKKVQIESRVMVRMAVNHIIPAAIDYKTRLLNEVALSQDVFGDTSGCSVELGLIN